MRELADRERIWRFLRLLGRSAREQGRVYLTGGATAVLVGWRERSPFVVREGLLDVHHFDPYSQALSKLERGFEQDLSDVAEMVRRGLVDPALALELFLAIAPDVYRYPAIDPRAFEGKVEEFFGRS